MSSESQARDIGVAVSVTIVLLTMVLLAFKAKQRWRPHGLFHLRRIPGASVETTLLVTDIEDR